MTIEIGDHIRTYRKAKGMTQKELAKLIGKSYSLIQKYEMGITQPPIDVLEKIAHVLEVSISDLTKKTLVLELPDTIGKVFDFRDDIEKEIDEILATLNIEGKKKALEYLRDLAMLPKYTENADAEEGEGAS